MSLKKFIPLFIGFVVGGLIWHFLGSVLREISNSLWVVGGVNGAATIIGGVGANVVAEKILGISDEADV